MQIITDVMIHRLIFLPKWHCNKYSFCQFNIDIEL